MFGCGNVLMFNLDLALILRRDGGFIILRSETPVTTSMLLVILTLH